MSKQEADGLQMDVDEISHSDSEEIHLTTEAFQQAVHPSVKESRPYVSQSNNTSTQKQYTVKLRCLELGWVEYHGWLKLN
jgi:hypothetical protein